MDMAVKTAMVEALFEKHDSEMDEYWKENVGLEPINLPNRKQNILGQRKALSPLEKELRRQDQKLGISSDTPRVLTPLECKLLEQETRAAIQWAKAKLAQA